MIQVEALTNPSPLVIALFTALTTSITGHLFVSIRSWRRRRRQKDNLRTILASELQSNSKRLWLVFAANEHMDMFLSDGPGYSDSSVEKDDVDMTIQMNKLRKRERIYFLARQSGAGFHYTQYKAVADQIGTLDRSEVQAIQSVYQSIKTLEESLENISPSHQFIGEGDSILSIETMAMRSEIGRDGQKALVEHLKAIRALQGLTNTEKRQLEIGESDSPDRESIEEIHEEVTGSD